MSTAAVAGDLGKVRPPSPFSVLSSPVSVFVAVRRSPRAHRIAACYLVLLPLLPVLTAVAGYQPLVARLEGQSETLRSSAPILAIAFGMSVLLAQVLFMALNLAAFGFLARLAGARASGRLIVIGWLYAIMPLTIRQFFLGGVALIAGPEWFRDHSGVVTYVDPFLVWAAVLLYLTGVHTLSLTRPAAALIAFVCSFAGAVVALAQFL